MKSWFTGYRLVFADGLHKLTGHTDGLPENKSLPRYRIIRYIIALFCTLEILDAVITGWAVSAGLVQEGNPLVAHMAGDWSFIILKLIGAVLSGLTLQILYEHFPRLALLAAVSITFFYITVLAWNSGTIFSTCLPL